VSPGTEPVVPQHHAGLAIPEDTIPDGLPSTVPDDTETPEPLEPETPPPIDGLSEGAVWPQAVAEPITNAATAAARAKRRRLGYLRDTFMARSLRGRR
jgi:hypothetical protein